MWQVGELLAFIHATQSQYLSAKKAARASSSFVSLSIFIVTYAGGRIVMG
jgi:hypothetical protein